MRQLHQPETSEIDLTRVLSALGDPVRLNIVQVLSDGAEHSHADFDFDLAQSTLSHHMKKLREAGVVRSRPEGTRCYVSLRPEIHGLFPGLLESILAAAR